jgi:hypothetical protein
MAISGPLKKIFILLNFFVSLFMFFSCSEAGAGISNVTGTVVFDYADEKSNPDVYLSVFVQTEAEAQRAELLKVYSPDKNIYWNIHNPVVFSGNSKSYAGYSILKPAEGKKIEQGEYRVLYTDASGEEAETSFTVYYRDEMLTSKSEGAKDKTGLTLTENVIIYDKNMNMLFWGNMKNAWRNYSNILKEYSRAVYIRKVYSSSGSTIMVKMPPETIKNSKAADKTERGSGDSHTENNETAGIEENEPLEE